MDQCPIVYAYIDTCVPYMHSEIQLVFIIKYTSLHFDYKRYSCYRKIKLPNHTSPFIRNVFLSASSSSSCACAHCTLKICVSRAFIRFIIEFSYVCTIRVKSFSLYNTFSAHSIFNSEKKYLLNTGVA